MYRYKIFSTLLEQESGRRLSEKRSGKAEVHLFHNNIVHVTL